MWTGRGLSDQVTNGPTGLKGGTEWCGKSKEKKTVLQEEDNTYCRIDVSVMWNTIFVNFFWLKHQKYRQPNL